MGKSYYKEKSCKTTLLVYYMTMLDICQRMCSNHEEN